MESSSRISAVATPNGFSANVHRIRDGKIKHVFSELQMMFSASSAVDELAIFAFALHKVDGFATLINLFRHQKQAYLDQSKELAEAWMDFIEDGRIHPIAAMIPRQNRELQDFIFTDCCEDLEKKCRALVTNLPGSAKAQQLIAMNPNETESELAIDCLVVCVDVLQQTCVLKRCMMHLMERLSISEGECYYDFILSLSRSGFSSRRKIPALALDNHVPHEEENADEQATTSRSSVGRRRKRGEETSRDDESERNRRRVSGTGA